MTTWLEVTNRSDLGANLKAPKTDDNGRDYWSYSLITQVKRGDLVLHYHKPAQAIVARSVASSHAWSDTIVWGARGSTARTSGRSPHERPGWCLALDAFESLATPVTLNEMRSREADVREIRSRLVGEDARYFPFALSDKRVLRPSQGYLMRWPDSLSSVFPGLMPIVSAPQMRSERLGADYRKADEFTAVSIREPFEVDPAEIERGLRGHASTQNALAAVLSEAGIDPRSPQPDEPNYDLAWTVGERIFVAEVKSLSTSNEEKQLRLGLGQILRYAHLLSTKAPLVTPVLAVERAPADQSWLSLCAHLGVRLSWPADFQRLVNSDD